mgnify:CR=1 FL=1
MLTPEQLNALLVICDEAPIKGRDSEFMTELKAKLREMKQNAETPPKAE